MKKVILLTILCFLLASCTIPPPPNPGFRVTTEIEVNQGFIFPVYIPVTRSGTVTNGHFREEILGPMEFSGTVGTFTGKVSSFAGIFDVDGGKAPALWFFTGVSGWEDCNGSSNFFKVYPGTNAEAVCRHKGGFFPFLLSPSTVNQYSQPIELQATINGIDTSYGMPIFHFEDYTGQLMVTTTATQVNGTDVRTGSGSLTDMPIGTYSVKVYNAPSPNSSPNNPVGLSNITVSEPPPPTCTVPPGGINQDTCEGALGKMWDPETCSCHNPY